MNPHAADATVRPGRSDVGTTDGDLAEVRARLLAGAPLRLDRLPPRAARAVVVARAAGAPAVPALDAVAEAATHLRRRRQALDVATAQARTVAVGLAALPVLAIGGLGALLDAPLWRFFLTPVGLAVGSAGLLLALTGVVIALHLVRRTGRAPASGRVAPAVAVGVGVATAVLVGVVAGAVAGVVLGHWAHRRRSVPVPAAPGTDEVADLVAIALSGGLPAPAALRAVADVLPDVAAELQRAALAHELGVSTTLPLGVDRIGAVLRTASRYGSPAAPALRRVAADLRDEELGRALAASERLPALLAFPTALCLMPACVLLIGAPLLAHGLAAAGGGP